MSWGETVVAQDARSGMLLTTHSSRVYRHRLWRCKKVCKRSVYVICVRRCARLYPSITAFV